MSATINNSIQETAAAFANGMLASLNKAVGDIAGVDVMWFRLIPDKKNQDVLFQSYTLYGVEDCPLSFRAMYSDTHYDDAAITYNIMGLEYSIPLTLEIPCNTWYEVTKKDGTLPQRGDIVFVPLSEKLLEVVSMTPVKALAAQVTSYKVNLKIYEPSRSRIVGENLKESIEKNTVNLESRFGDEIKEAIDNISDVKQLDLHDSTEKDKFKTVTKTVDEETGRLCVESIIKHDLQVDGHVVARTYYDLNKASIITKYNATDTISAESERCLSCWLNINESQANYKNVKEITVSENASSLTIVATGKFPEGTDVVLERGNTTLLGKVSQDNTISVNPVDVKKLAESNPNWFKIPGFILKKDTIVHIISADKMDISLHNCNVMSVTLEGKTMNHRLTQNLTTGNWYGIIVNLSPRTNIDIFKSDESLERIISMHGLGNRYWKDISFNNFVLKGSAAYITNLRYYKCANNEIDKQITDLVSYNIPNDSMTIINDSADVYLNKTYTGTQR